MHFSLPMGNGQYIFHLCLWWCREKSEDADYYLCYIYITLPSKKYVSSAILGFPLGFVAVPVEEQEVFLDVSFGDKAISDVATEICTSSSAIFVYSVPCVPSPSKNKIVFVTMVNTVPIWIPGNIPVPPFFSTKIFFKKSPPLIFIEKNRLRPLSMVPARVPHEF